MSTDKQQLEIKISNMERELAEMKKILATPEPISTYWTPNTDNSEKYFFVNQIGNIKNDRAIDRLISRYRVFKTEAEAFKYAEYIKAEETLKKAIADLNQGWWPDFTNSKQDKFCFYRHNNVLSLIEFYIERWLYRKEQPAFMYMKSRKIAETIRDKYKDELITYFSY